MPFSFTFTCCRKEQILLWSCIRMMCKSKTNRMQGGVQRFNSGSRRQCKMLPPGCLGALNTTCLIYLERGRHSNHPLIKPPLRNTFNGSPGGYALLPNPSRRASRAKSQLESSPRQLNYLGNCISCHHH